MKTDKISEITASEGTDSNQEALDGQKSEKAPIEVSEKEEQSEISWDEFVTSSNEYAIKERYAKEIKEIFKEHKKSISNYCCLALIEPEASISSFDLDQIYGALAKCNPKKDKDVLLFLLSPGGNIENAYQISNLCKSYSKNKFVVAVPRNAKSAATLISLGADEIHMGPLSQLGPIDPQLGGLPALGVTQALQSIASLSERYPGSSDMFARYLRMALTVEQIGYCERISESAEQYAERLLLKKKSISKDIKEISHTLVHEYKHHGFVIDTDEAKAILGSEWIVENSIEIAVAEKIYKLFDNVNFLLRYYRNKRLLSIGTFESGTFIFNKQK